MPYKDPEIKRIKDKEYREANKESLKKYFKTRYKKNKDSILEGKRKYYKKTRAHHIEKMREYNNSHKEERNIRDNNRRKNDPVFKITENIRSRIRGAIKNGYTKKAYKTIELLGCEFEQLKEHLESQFEGNMSWDNYGDWHIDHIKPCAAFNLTDPEQQKECFNYKNLQPLWAKDNISKGDKYKE